MVERICPQCQHGNPIENRFCSQCGTPMERHALGTTQQTALALANQFNIPVRLKQLGQAVAVSLAALAVEAGLGWIRKKVEQINQPSPMVVKTPQVTYLPASQSDSITLIPAQPNGVVTVTSQRVVETWEHGILTKQTVERNVWRREVGR